MATSTATSSSSVALKLQCCGKFRSVQAIRYRSRGREREYDYARACAVEPRWEIDGRFYCINHAEQFWTDHFVHDHHVRRLFPEDIREALEEMAQRRGAK